MRKLFLSLGVLFLLVLSSSSFALLRMELTQGVAGAVPLAMVPFLSSGVPSPEPVSEIINNDLAHSGRFKIYAMDSYTPDKPDSSWLGRKVAVDNVLMGKVESVGGDSYQVSFQLMDTPRGKTVRPIVILDQKFTVSGKQLRHLAHHISDLVFEKIIGVRGIFSTRLVYVVVKRGGNARAQYTLEVADQDGYNPRMLLSSTDPIMSPAWSPDGKRIAYVSFENRKASIYTQDLATGNRELVSQVPGINGAPAWSPDGKKLALVLSKGESPNIYILDLASRHLTPITHDWYINTEPAWFPNGRALLFTSNRSGGPQIYQYNLGSGEVTRLTYDGDYNARGGLAPDGKHLVTIHRDKGAYSIAIFDLATGSNRMLTASGTDNGSPSVAPNGGMVLFDTLYNGRSVLGIVSTDGRVQQRLPARDGEAQDAAWSPFMS